MKNIREQLKRAVVLLVLVLSVGLSELRGQAGIENLSCEVSPILGGIELNWTVVGSVDSIEIFLNGAPSTSLPGTETTFLQPLAGFQIYDFEIYSISAGIVTFDDFCLVQTGSVLPPISDLALSSTLDSGIIDLEWAPSNPVFDAIEVWVDGLLEDVLPGTATSYSILPRPLLSRVGVCLIGLDGQGPLSQPACGEIALPADLTGRVAILTGEQHFGPGLGFTDSVAAVEQALTESGWPHLRAQRAEDLEGSLPPVLIWAVMGTFPAMQFLEPSDGDVLAAAVASGTPLILEGSSLWSFGLPTAIHDWDGVGTAAPGDGTLVRITGGAIQGFDLSSVDTVYQWDQQVDYNDQLNTTSGDLGGGTSEILMTSSTGGYGVAIYKDSDPGIGDVLSCSFEFGGLETSGLEASGLAGGRSALAAQFMERMVTIAPSPTFFRGDCNGDGGVDVSDPVFLLAALFILGSEFPSCEDSADFNDDGLWDISDAVFGLAALFIPGSAPIGPPGIGQCGIDLTSDSLTCISSACP